MKPFNECISSMEKDLMNRQIHMNEMRELDDFKNSITQIVENYIKMIDTKISSQDLEIKKATAYMVENITQSTNEFVTRLFHEGKIAIDLTYDPNTEQLFIGGELIE